jgi:hypothetical protein
MPSLRHLSTSPWRFYQGTDPDTARPWPVGEVREVGQDCASYLLAEYPEAFALADEVKAIAPAEPEVDRAMKPPAKRKAAKAKKATT